jgi:hypothetical protein
MHLFRLLALTALHAIAVRSFSPPASNQLHRCKPNAIIHRRSQSTLLFAEMSEAELKTELSKYLKKREDVMADEAAKA